MAKRKPIPMKIRFMVLQRDNFTCQYCGRKAPNVELHVDHMIPVSKGGKDALWNYITSCRDCNLGKSDISTKGTDGWFADMIVRCIEEDTGEKLDAKWNDYFKGLMRVYSFQEVDNSILRLFDNRKDGVPIEAVLKAVAVMCYFEEGWT